MMKKFIQFALMATMMLPSAVVLNACGDDDEEKPDSGEVDTRIEKVVPNEYRKQMEKYMTIYDGVNPPNVEGTFVMSKCVLVYTSEGSWDPGHEFVDTYMMFSNQNSKNNTIDYKEKSGVQTATGNGAYISGNGNNFTIYFNTNGKYNGKYNDINFKTALVISGTKTSKGISNAYYAFVMTEKSNDSNNEMMDEGDFRVIKDNDGLAESTTWLSSTRIPEFVGNKELFSVTSSGK